MVGNNERPRRRRASRVRIAFWTGAAALMALPLIAMQFTTDVMWDFADFAFLAALLLGVGAAYERLARTSRNSAYRAAAIVALAGAFLIVWLNAAVGIIGSEQNDANLLFAGVLAVGIGAACFARLQPLGMARAMIAAAAAQVLVAAIGLIGGLGASGPDWPLDLLGLTAFFVMVWLVSALLFRKAGHAAHGNFPAKAA